MRVLYTSAAEQLSIRRIAFRKLDLPHAQTTIITTAWHISPAVGTLIGTCVTVDWAPEYVHRPVPLRGKACQQDNHGVHCAGGQRRSPYADAEREIEPVTPTALYRSMLVTSATMSERLDRLEPRKPIRRRRTPSLHRSVHIELTPTWRRLIDRTHVDLVNAEAALLDGLPEADRKTLARILARLATNLERRGALE